MNTRTAACSICKSECKKHSSRIVSLITMDGKVKLKVGVYRCMACSRYFKHPLYRKAVGAPKGSYAKEVRDKALSFIKDGESYSSALREMRVETGISIPMTTFHEWIIIYL